MGSLLLKKKARGHRYPVPNKTLGKCLNLKEWHFHFLSQEHV